MSIIGVKNLLGILGAAIFRRPGLTAAARKRGDTESLGEPINVPCFLPPKEDL